MYSNFQVQILVKLLSIKIEQLVAVVRAVVQ